ncbi:MAG: type IV pilus twitching motility protein PilT [Deltaproteobacteria bacterium]|nr:type IV pilus twitching motility protein PilT [Deltaproteobacteria bacterium]MBW2307300.1 type IV pilus twitching motility protein PilT [Deltaproteobacteria bacterium]
MELNDILKFALSKGASDVHLKVGLTPVLRINGTLVPIKDIPKLTPEETKRMAMGIMSDRQKERFLEFKELDMAYGSSGLGRFRVNVFMQRDNLGMVLRTIPTEPPALETLGLPKVLSKIAMEHRGMVLVTGTTGSGKSTTLAAMIGYINTHRTTHIITIEDPIEFLHRDRRSIINQREVGQDTTGFAKALRAALRQDPDVILVGEMRDLETIGIALTAAETGHLVFSTLHTLDAMETITRIISAFPLDQEQAIRNQLSGVIKAVISQRLLPRADRKGRVVAAEVLVSTARIRECVSDPAKTIEIREAMAEGVVTYGMQTFDQSLMGLLKSGLITLEEALNNATNPGDFELRYKGISATSDATFDDFMAEGEAEKKKLPF